MNRIVRVNSVLVVLLLNFFLGVCNLNAQGASSLTISEVMTLNDNSIVDEYSRHSPWVEIYNTSSTMVDIKGCYLSDDNKNITKYRIPTWSNKTKIGPRQFVIIWLDSNEKDGIMHANFTLDPTKQNELILTDADGKSIISSVSVPIIPTNHSYKNNNLAGNIDGNTSSVSWSESDHPTPLEPNQEVKSSNKIENLETMDPSGFIMTLTAVSVVFLALITLSIVFYFIGRLMSRPRVSNKKITSAKNKYDEAKEIDVAILMAITQNRTHMEDNVVAISLALSQCRVMVHDGIGARLTIKRRNSKWNDSSQRLRRYDY